MNFLNSILKLKEPKKSLRGVTYIKYALILTLSPYFFNIFFSTCYWRKHPSHTPISIRK